MDVLDDSIGDLSAAIHDREATLLREVGEEVLKEEVPLTEAVRACAEVDVLMSFAQLAGGLAWVRPMVTEEKVVVIKDGRHPLQVRTDGGREGGREGEKEGGRVCARLAGGLAWMKPMITEEKVVVIKDGRHPLQVRLCPPSLPPSHPPSLSPWVC